jgi:hypothetical protein
MFFCSTKERDEFSLLCRNYFCFAAAQQIQIYMFFRTAKERDEFSLLCMIYFCSAAAQQVRNLNSQIQNMIPSTGTDSRDGKYMISFLFK